VNRVVAVVVGVLAGAAASVALGLATPGLPPRPAPRALRDSGGAIASLLIHYTPETAAFTLPAYEGLLSSLAPDTAVLVAVEERAHFDDLAAGVESSRLSPIVVGRPITTWSRDRFLTASLAGSPLLVVPRQRLAPVPTRANDPLVPWAVGRARPRQIAVTSSELAFDGGDLVADEERVYATAVLLERNRDRQMSFEEARVALGELTGLEPVLLGSRPEEVPIHHIGMFVTPIGSDTVLVGSPALGARLLDETTAARLDADLSARRQGRFDRIASDLEAAGLQVVRLPLIPTGDELVYLTWNNVLIDDRPDGRHVILPRYGEARLDAAGRAAWRELGFVVHSVDVSRLYRSGGTVRCLAAVIERA